MINNSKKDYVLEEKNKKLMLEQKKNVPLHPHSQSAL